MVEGKGGFSRKNLIDLMFILVFAIFIVSMFGFVIADTTFSLNITNSSESINFTYSNCSDITVGCFIHTFINEDVMYKFNFSINHSSATRNLTRINFTLPEYFIWTLGSNITSNNSQTIFFNWTNTSANGPFTLFWNTTTNLSTFIVNRTGAASFGSNTRTGLVFNLTALHPGTYNITITYIYNYSTSSGNVDAFNTTYINVIVNDTTSPENITFSNTKLLNNSNRVDHSVGNFSGNLVLNVSVGDSLGYGSIGDVFFNITNRTGGTNNGTGFGAGLFYAAINTSTSPNWWTYTLDTTKLADGDYNITVWVNDSNGNVNNTRSVNITVDNTVPTGVMTCSPVDAYVGSTITCTCTSSDAFTGISASGNTYTASPSTSDAGSGLTQTCTFTDNAGNAGSATSAVYTIWGSPADGGNGGSGGSSGTTTTFTYSKTIPQTSQDFSAISTIQTSSFSGGGLSAKEKVTFKLNNEEHYVGIKTLTSSSATIEIASTPVQLTLNIGGGTKQDLNNDGFYDVYVQLNGIANGKADMTISYIHEQIPEGATTPPAEEEEETTTPPAEEAQEAAVPYWVWIIIGVIVLAVIIGLGVKLKKKR